MSTSSQSSKLNSMKPPPESHVLTYGYVDQPDRYTDANVICVECRKALSRTGKNRRHRACRNVDGTLFVLVTVTNVKPASKGVGGG